MLSRTRACMWVLIVGLIGTSASDVPVYARADDAPGGSVSSEVLVLLASWKPGEIDPSLRKLRALKQPPLNSYRSMRVLSRATLRLVEDDWVEVSLPNGRKLHLNLVQRLPDGRSKVQLSINRPNKKDYLPWLQVIASPGEPFFVAGQKFQDETLVIGVRVGDRAQRR